MGLPKKLPEFVLVALVCLMIGYGTGTVLTERKKMVTLEHSVTLLWSDGEFDEPALGAHVFGAAHGRQIRATARVHRPPPTQVFHARPNW